MCLTEWISRNPATRFPILWTIYDLSLIFPWAVLASENSLIVRVRRYKSHFWTPHIFMMANGDIITSQLGLSDALSCALPSSVGPNFDNSVGLVICFGLCLWLNYFEKLGGKEDCTLGKKWWQGSCGLMISFLSPSVWGRQFLVGGTCPCWQLGVTFRCWA